MNERKDFALSLLPKEAKLARLAFDKGAIEGEAIAAFTKLRQSLITTGALAIKDNVTPRVRAPRKPKPTPPPPPPPPPRQPGDTLIPFGPTTGMPIRNVDRYELMHIANWCERKAPERFDYLIRDIYSFLSG